MKRLIVGLTGATGVIMGVRLLETLYAMDVETHLVISDAAVRNVEIETDYSVEEISELADVTHDFHDVAAVIASGSFRTDGMIVMPCSIKTLSSIANSYADNLITRAADCTLKEGRKLVLAVRETPLHKGHLQLMARVNDIGGVILPPVPAFYNHPETIEDLIDHFVGKILDQFGMRSHSFKRWEGV